MATFRNVNFKMVRGNESGQYYIVSRYKGEDFNIRTTNSEAWDYIDDESNPDKHLEALQYCYDAIMEAYDNRIITIYI